MDGKSCFITILIVLSAILVLSMGCVRSAVGIESKQSSYKYDRPYWVRNNTNMKCRYGVGIINETFNCAGTLLPLQETECMGFGPGKWIFVFSCGEDMGFYYQKFIWNVTEDIFNKGEKEGNKPVFSIDYTQERICNESEKGKGY